MSELIDRYDEAACFARVEEIKLEDMGSICSDMQVVELDIVRSNTECQELFGCECSGDFKNQKLFATKDSQNQEGTTKSLREMVTDILRISDARKLTAICEMKGRPLEIEVIKCQG